LLPRPFFFGKKRGVSKKRGEGGRDEAPSKGGGGGGGGSLALLRIEVREIMLSSVRDMEWGERSRRPELRARSL